MFKKIKKYFADRKAKKAKLAEMKKYQKYYEILQSGQLFIEFVIKDMELSKKNHMNRHERRRMESDLMKKGKITPEIVAHYKMKIQQVFKYIDQQTKLLNKPPVKIKTQAPKREIKEGPVCKGGLNTKPSTPRPDAPKGQSVK